MNTVYDWQINLVRFHIFLFKQAGRLEKRDEGRVAIHTGNQ